MDVSVIIPTWQRAGLLASRSLPSVLAQDADFELLVVADGPDPAAQAVVDGLHDARARFLVVPRPEYPEDPVLRWKALGVRAINAGIHEARGDWLLVMGDDDELELGALRVLLERASGTAADVVYGGSLVRQRDGAWAIVSDWPPKFTGFPFGAAIISRASLGPIRLDPDAWQRGESADADFWKHLYTWAVFAHEPSVVFKYWPSTAYELPA